MEYWGLNSSWLHATQKPFAFLAKSPMIFAYLQFNKYFMTLCSSIEHRVSSEFPKCSLAQQLDS